MRQNLIGRTIKAYTKKGFFYRGEVVDEDETHVFIHDFKTDSDVMLAREWLSEVITEDGQE